MDVARAAAIVRRQFPQLPLSRVGYLGEACDNWAFEVDGRWVFRFPKRACRGVGDVAFGRKTGRAEYVAAGFRALRACLDETPAAEG
jgi:hypothetical protein